MRNVKGQNGVSRRSGRSGSSGFIGSIPDGKKSTTTAMELFQSFNQEGFNDHELDAMVVDYIDNYFEYYLPLKLKLLKMRKDANGDNAKVYNNYLKVLVYTLFENSWFVFLMTDEHEFYFSKNNETYDNPYHNHLPSFSSALLHIGSCYDQFFVFIKLFYEGKITGPKDFKDVLRVKFRSPTGMPEYLNVLNRISNDTDYIKKGSEILNSNKFRNYFAHQVRLLWCHRDNTKLYYFPRDLYNKIMNDGSDGRQEVFNMLIDTKQYEKKIQTEDVKNMISSKEIIINYHSEMTKMFNLTFYYILNNL
jgi:hypothetical protein